MNLRGMNSVIEENLPSNLPLFIRVGLDVPKNQTRFTAHFYIYRLDRKFPTP